MEVKHYRQIIFSVQDMFMALYPKIRLFDFKLIGLYLHGVVAWLCIRFVRVQNWKT